MDIGNLDCQVVNLNIGGTKYMTTFRTLLREKDTFFSEILVSKSKCHDDVATKLPDGSFFVDRDGELFVFILDYLRTGKLLLPDNFNDTARLKEEVLFYKLQNMNDLLTPYFNLRYPGQAAKGTELLTLQSTCESGGFITLGYRGTFAFGRDGQADVKFRKLHRILVCGKIALCREVFTDTLNESRDPDREGSERYTSRLYLKHQCLERACDNLAEKGFKLVATCSSGANGLATAGFSVLGSQMNANQQDFVTKRNSGDFEEQRWAHYTEYVFYREPHLSTADSIAESR